MSTAAVATATPAALLRKYRAICLRNAQLADDHTTDINRYRHATCGEHAVEVQSNGAFWRNEARACDAAIIECGGQL